MKLSTTPNESKAILSQIHRALLSTTASGKNIIIIELSMNNYVRAEDKGPYTSFHAYRGAYQDWNSQIVAEL